ncbi:MAG: hypothetical protein ACYSUQ_12235, partial [Planctomycetota bacterium]
MHTNIPTIAQVMAAIVLLTGLTGCAGLERQSEPVAVSAEPTPNAPEAQANKAAEEKERKT